MNMKVYVALRESEDCFFEYEYCGISASLEGAKNILQNILNELYDDNRAIETYEEPDDASHLTYFINDGLIFKIWEEII